MSSIFVLIGSDGESDFTIWGLFLTIIFSFVFGIYCGLDDRVWFNNSELIEHNLLQHNAKTGELEPTGKLKEIMEG